MRNRLLSCQCMSRLTFGPEVQTGQTFCHTSNIWQIPPELNCITIMFHEGVQKGITQHSFTWSLPKLWWLVLRLTSYTILILFYQQVRHGMTCFQNRQHACPYYIWIDSTGHRKTYSTCYFRYVIPLKKTMKFNLVIIACTLSFGLSVSSYGLVQMYTP